LLALPPTEFKYGTRYLISVISFVTKAGKLVIGGLVDPEVIPRPVPKKGAPVTHLAVSVKKPTTAAISSGSAILGLARVASGSGCDFARKSLLAWLKP
jgi:hypothetical protein